MKKKHKINTKKVKRLTHVKPLHIQMPATVVLLVGSEKQFHPVPVECGKSKITHLIHSQVHTKLHYTFQ